MKHRYLVFLIFLLMQGLSAQDITETVIKPLLLDKEVLSGIGLKKVDIKAEPEKDFYQKQLFRGNDISVYVVSTETWNNRMDNFPFDEFVYMLHGEAIVKPDQGPAQLFHSGDYFFAPKGFTGEWEIKAGAHLHYELSVIATKRADSSAVIKNQRHHLISRSTLSGAQIQLDEEGLYKETLISGAELNFKLQAEKPSSGRSIRKAKEMMIQVLSGQITLVDSNEEKQVFQTGDFFIIPTAFTGTWMSDGHGLVKYLVVERS